MTRTELIEQLRENAPWCSNATCDLQIKAADMLKADALEIAEADTDLIEITQIIEKFQIKEKQLREAARLALDALLNSADLVTNEYTAAVRLHGDYQPRQPRIRALLGLDKAHDEAIKALKEALK